MTLSETAHSPWNPRQVAPGVLLGSFRVWSGSASCCQGVVEGEASLARSASHDACPLALPALFVSSIFSGLVKLEAFFGHFFRLSLNLSTDLISRSVACVRLKKSRDTLDWAAQHETPRSTVRRR